MRKAFFRSLLESRRIGMAIQRTGHVAIRVRDLEAAKRFYGEILGMKLGMEIPGQGLFFRFNNYHHDLAVFKARDIGKD